MKRIQTDDELARLRQAGEGLIYNDYAGRGPRGDEWNVLHAAGCREVAQSNVNIPKFFFDSLSEAEEWLTANRGPEGRNWKRCGTCQASAAESPGATARSASPLARQRRAPAADSEPFREVHVEDILVPWLEARGYTVQRQVAVANGVVDVVADGPDGRWIVEAKGEDRGGYGSAEMNLQMGLGQIVSRMAEPAQNYALAIPGTPHFRAVLKKFRGTPGFARLGVALFVVERGGEVSRVEAGEVAGYLEGLE